MAVRAVRAVRAAQTKRLSSNNGVDEKISTDELHEMTGN
jgi:hypothetical protein